MMTMRRVVVAPRLRKEVFLMAFTLLIEIELRVELKEAVQRVLYSGIMSPLTSSNIHCPINILRSLQNNNTAMVLHNQIVLKINRVGVQMRKQRQQQPIRI
jgi:hypothetical protein